MANPRYNPNLGPQGYANYPGAIASPNWQTALQADSPEAQVAFGQGAGAPDLATQNEAAASAAAQAGIARQKREEAIDAMASRYKLDPESDKVQRQFKTADAIRRLGSSFNTGSVDGGAPNYMGALANVVGAYMGKKQQDEANAGASALGDRYSDIAAKYFRSAPKDAAF